MIEHLEMSFAQKDAHTNQLADENAMFTYELALSEVHGKFLEQALENYKESTGAQQAEVNKLWNERDKAIQELNNLKIQLELALNVIFLVSKMSTLEGIHEGIPNLEGDFVR